MEPTTLRKKILQVLILSGLFTSPTLPFTTSLCFTRHIGLLSVPETLEAYSHFRAFILVSSLPRMHLFSGMIHSFTSFISLFKCCLLTGATSSYASTSQSLHVLLPFFFFQQTLNYISLFVYMFIVYCLLSIYLTKAGTSCISFTTISSLSSIVLANSWC